MIDDGDSIRDFTEEICTDDLDVDVWEERQRLKQNGKGKERELINGAQPATQKGREKVKPPAKKRGKTDEEKVGRTGQRSDARPSKRFR